MSRKQITNATAATVTDLVQALIVAEGSTYGAKAQLAARYNEYLGENWFAMPRSKTPAFEAVEAARLDFKAQWEAGGMAHFDQAWQSVKKYAAEIAAGVRDAETGRPIKAATEGEGEGEEGEGGNGAMNARRDADTAWRDELAKLINRTDKDAKAGRAMQLAPNYARIARIMVGLNATRLEQLARLAEEM